MASGMGFNALPPLPIISIIFGFFDLLNLRIVGIDLQVVSRWFGWKLALFEVDLTQTRCESVLEFSKALFGGDVRPNRVQPLMNPGKGKFDNKKHLLRSMSYSQKKPKRKIEKRKKVHTCSNRGLRCSWRN